jgi:nucleoside-diphosphate-sugar epimerase
MIAKKSLRKEYENLLDHSWKAKHLKTPKCDETIIIKCAVTGASGFIGKHVVAEALREGYGVVAITRQGQKAYLESFLIEHKEISIANLEVRTCDLNDNQTLMNSIADCNVAVHLAASLDSSIIGGRPDGKQQYQQTIKTTENLFEAISTSNIKKLVLVSSISVLNYVDQAPYSTIDEKTPLHNRDKDIGAYARMKRDQEKLCSQWQLDTGKKLIIVRPGLVFSDKQLSDAHAGFIKKGAGIAAIHNGQVPLIKVKYVAERIIKLLDLTLDSKELFHIVGKIPILQTDYLKQLRRRGKLKFYLPLPWKIYEQLINVIRWILIKNKQSKIPDSFYANSVAARQKPFVYSSEKIDNLIK